MSHNIDSNRHQFMSKVTSGLQCTPASDPTACAVNFLFLWNTSDSRLFLGICLKDVFVKFDDADVVVSRVSIPSLSVFPVIVELVRGEFVLLALKTVK